MVWVSAVGLVPPAGLRVPRRALVPSPAAPANGATIRASASELPSSQRPRTVAPRVLLSMVHLRLGFRAAWPLEPPTTHRADRGCGRRARGRRHAYDGRVAPAVFHFDFGSPYSYLAAERVNDVLPDPPVWQPVYLVTLYRASGRRSWVYTDRREEEMAIVAARAAERGL